MNTIVSCYKSSCFVYVVEIKVQNKTFVGMLLASHVDLSQRNKMGLIGKTQASSGVRHPTSVSTMCSGRGVRHEFKAQGDRPCVPPFGGSPLLVSHCLVIGSKSN